MTDRRTVPTTDHRLTPAPGWHAVSVYAAGSTPLGLDPSGEELTAPEFHVHVDPLIGWATSTLHEPSLRTGEPEALLDSYPAALAEGRYVVHAGESVAGDGSPFGGLWWTLTPSYGRAPRGRGETWEPWHSAIYGAAEVAQHLGLTSGPFLIRWHEDGEPVRLLLCPNYRPTGGAFFDEGDPRTDPRSLMAREYLERALIHGPRTEAELTEACTGLPALLVLGALRHMVDHDQVTPRLGAGSAVTYALGGEESNR